MYVQQCTYRYCLTNIFQADRYSCVRECVFSSSWKYKLTEALMDIFLMWFGEQKLQFFHLCPSNDAQSFILPMQQNQLQEVFPQAFYGPKIRNSLSRTTPSAQKSKRYPEKLSLSQQSQLKDFIENVTRYLASCGAFQAVLVAKMRAQEEKAAFHGSFNLRCGEWEECE